MSNFQTIQNKLHDFIKKYYTNEIIKGSILFLSFGLLYFIFTLFIEYILWLKPVYRTILFWFFILVEIALLTKFIFIPLTKLLGLQKGISQEQASKIIGHHFNDVDDKLLNIIQLHDSHLHGNDNQSELLLASIEQKSAEIQPFPFKKAINYSANKKYIKYLSLPLLIWLIAVFTGNNSILTKSLDRVVHYKTQYQPPAPFYFQIINKDLKAIEGKSFDLMIKTIGDIVPQQVKVFFKDQSYLLKNINPSQFSYKFEHIDTSFPFYIEANGIRSPLYQIEVIKTPNIQDFEMLINYPDYTNKLDTKINNTGNAIVPEGTLITWQLKTKTTDLVRFLTEEKDIYFKQERNDLFILSKQVNKTTSYQISSSNKELKDYEKLKYQIETIKDEYPQIIIKTDIDSITRGQAHFIGQISDDYGINKLQVYFKELGTNQNQNQIINIQRTAFEEFYYVFPEGIDLQPNKTYELYFEVYDNDDVNGSKSTKSTTYYYNQKTKQQITEELLKEQQENFNEIQSTTKKREDLNKSLEDFNNKLKNKSEIEWNEKRDLDQYLERQKMYKQMLKENADKILENLEELEVDENLNKKKEALQKRIEELKELDKNQKLLDELEKLAEKLKKEGLIDQLDKLTEKNKQQNRSLERILELTKRFYVEKKFNEISKNLQRLAKEQDELSKENQNNNSENQKLLNNKFDSIQKDFNELNKENKNLKQPMSLPESFNDQKQIEKDMLLAKENLEQNEKINNSKHKKNAVKNQKSAAQKMKKLSEKMDKSMQQMELQTIDENIDDLQQILDNLLIFSFDQEALMLSFDETALTSADFSQKLVKQQILKEYFEHIDDSLYTLSLRLVRLTSRIQNDLTNAHYNLDKTLENISENRIKQGTTNQQYTMTAANNLADLLSNILQNLKEQKNNKGQGKGKKAESINLPDIIKKQNELLKKLQGDQMQGKKSGEKPSEQMSGEQYQIYKEQYQLREALKKLMNKDGNNGKSNKEAQKQMEELEKLLLEKGFNKQVIQKMKQIKHELLKLEDASFNKGKDNKRKSETNKIQYQQRTIDEIDSNSLFFNRDEILIRKTIPLTPYYQQRVNEYFKNN
ncbi:MAG: DUF4175 family protein [Bacteroidota bacterium]